MYKVIENCINSISSISIFTNSSLFDRSKPLKIAQKGEEFGNQQIIKQFIKFEKKCKNENFEPNNARYEKKSRK